MEGTLDELLDELFGVRRNEGSPGRISAITFLMMCARVVLQEHMSEDIESDETKKMQRKFSENLAESLMILGVTVNEITHVLDVVLPEMAEKQDEARWTPDLEKEG
jgi:hypothetical protein